MLERMSELVIRVALHAGLFIPAAPWRPAKMAPSPQSFCIPTVLSLQLKLLLTQFKNILDLALYFLWVTFVTTALFYIESCATFVYMEASGPGLHHLCICAT